MIKAKQLTEPLMFVDVLGREQCGQPGDYLIESSDGRRSIQRREIFEDIYVAMGSQRTKADCEGTAREPGPVEKSSSQSASAQLIAFGYNI